MRSPIVVAVLALVTSLHAQQTWTVPTDAPTLQAAIDAAAPGDTVTALATYTDAGGIVLSKALTLRDCRVTFVDGSFGLRIAGLAGGTRLALENVVITHFGDGFHVGAITALRIDLPPAASGDLVLDHVQVSGPLTLLPDRCALRVLGLGGATLAARGCTFRGANAFLPYQSSDERSIDGGPGAILAPGRYLFEDCTFLGGTGGSTSASAYAMELFRANPGGPGLVAAGDTVLVRCTVTDGDAGTAYGSPAYPPSDPCAFAQQPGVSVLPTELFEVTWQPGRVGGVVGCASQPPRPPQQVLGRLVDVLPAASTFTTGQAIIIDVAWWPGDTAILFGAGLPFGRTDFPGILGPVWMQQLVYGELLAAPASGSGLVRPHLTNVPAGLGMPIDFVGQALHANASGLALGAPRVVTIRP